MVEINIFQGFLFLCQVIIITYFVKNVYICESNVEILSVAEVIMFNVFNFPLIYGYIIHYCFNCIN